MDSTILSSPTRKNFANPTSSDIFYRLTEAEVIHFRACKYPPSVVTVYYHIKTLDPFGNGLQIIPKQIAKRLNYHHRTVSRAIKALVKAGELGLAIVEAHVKIVAQSVESVTEIVSKLGLGNTPTPDPIEPPVSMPVVETVIAPISTPPTAPEPQPSQSLRTTTNSKSGCSSVGSVIANMGFTQPPAPATNDPESAVKSPQWYAQIERQLNALDIQLKDVGHALKKYPVRAIEDGIAYTQKQTWSKAKAGVFVNYLKKWTPMTSTVQSQSKSAPEPVKTALIQRFPDIATTLAKEQNPIDEATLDYLERLRVDGLIHGTHYNTIDNYFGVFITQQDYPHPIPWWDALTRLQQLYPICA